MNETPLRIEVPGQGSVSALRTRAEGEPAGFSFIYAPGSGAGLTDAFGSFLARMLAQHGVDTLRFQFPYKEAGRSFPDKPEVSEATWLAAVEAAGVPPENLIIGGRSMGGRFASYVVAKGLPVAALVPFAYPLHPPDRPEQLRDAHFPDIKTPALFCSGTRDEFCTPEELKASVAKVPAAQLHFLEAADHAFAGAKGSGRTRKTIWTEAVQALLDFMAELR